MYDDVQWRIVLDGDPWPPREGEIWGRTPSQNMQLQIAAATWRIQTTNDTAFYQIALLLVPVAYNGTVLNLFTKFMLSLGF